MKETKLQEIFSERVRTKMVNYNGNQTDYKMRKMAVSLHNQFDKVWKDCLKGKATYEQWDKALNSWLDAELLA